MKYIVTIEFWKQLINQIIENNIISPIEISFINHRNIWYLKNFQIMPQNHNNNYKEGRLYFFNSLEQLLKFQYNQNDTLNLIYLLVYINIKKYNVYHRLVLFNGELTDLIELDLSKIINPIEILKHTGKNNLTLMKYRFAPKINLPKIYQTKCLILGTGTLGCNIARNLLSWGIETITFVDNGVVSHSNLLRQSLFQFQDIGQSKSLVASKRIIEIYPPYESSIQGFNLTIPMPDHPDTNDHLNDQIDQLDFLISQHDLIFLGTDNRESRWLPTLVACYHNKPLINLAVGFDNWVVMRHPLVSNSENNSNGQGLSDGLTVDQIGCYFCTSVEGVVNSIKDRQLDERCTVTRGGTSSIASAVAVELAIGLLNHPNGFEAISEINCQTIANSTMVVKCPPQQIRGSVNLLSSKHGLVRRNPQCCACSEKIINYYIDPTIRYKFLENVCQDSQILKKITCLDQFELSSSCDNLLELD